MSETILAVVGVYHADGGLRGELSYVFGRLRGTTHCALCDISHRGVRRKREWDSLPNRLGVPVQVVHLNERDAEIAVASEGRTPCVLARTGNGLVELLGPDHLERLHGDVDAFATALTPSPTRSGC